MALSGQHGRRPGSAVNLPDMTQPKALFVSEGRWVASLPDDPVFSAGVLETMRGEGAVIPLWPHHRARLLRCAQPGAETLEAIESALNSVLERCIDWGMPARLRLRYGAVGGCLRWDISASPLLPLPAWSAGINLIPCSVTFPVASKHSSGCKSLDRALYDKAAAELGINPGASEGLILDPAGKPIETLRCNLLAFTGGEWVTPDLKYHGVHGVMRAWLQGKLRIKETEMDLEALKEAEEVVLCNSLRGVIPVISLQGERIWQYGSEISPATVRLQQLVAKELW